MENKSKLNFTGVKNVAEGLTGMGILNRGAIRETQLLDLGFEWISQSKIYYYGMDEVFECMTIAMIDLLSLDNDTWVEKYATAKQYVSHFKRAYGEK